MSFFFIFLDLFWQKNLGSWLSQTGPHFILLTPWGPHPAGTACWWWLDPLRWWVFNKKEFWNACPLCSKHWCIAPPKPFSPLSKKIDVMIKYWTSLIQVLGWIFQNCKAHCCRCTKLGSSVHEGAPTHLPCRYWVESCCHSVLLIKLIDLIPGGGLDWKNSACT